MKHEKRKESFKKSVKKEKIQVGLTMEIKYKNLTLKSPFDLSKSNGIKFNPTAVYSYAQLVQQGINAITYKAGDELRIHYFSDKTVSLILIPTSKFEKMILIEDYRKKIAGTEKASDTNDLPAFAISEINLSDDTPLDTEELFILALDAKRKFYNYLEDGNPDINGGLTVKKIFEVKE